MNMTYLGQTTLNISVRILEMIFISFVMTYYELGQIPDFVLNSEYHLIGEFRALRVNSTK